MLIIYLPNDKSIYICVWIVLEKTCIHRCIRNTWEKIFKKIHTDMLIRERECVEEGGEEEQKRSKHAKTIER